ncbi:MAG: toxin-antitoxin system YwqK family antitoxin [Bacteroidota bacterium]
MRILFFAFLIVVGNTGCSDVETIENRSDEGVLIEKYTRKKDNFAKHGAYTSYHQNGQIFEERNYQNDQLAGVSKVYFENGKLDYVETHVDGSYEGLYQKYHESGQLANEGQYVNNEMSGIWKRWYENGTLREEVEFSENEENGPFKEYHENGKLKTEGVFLDGDNEQGELLIYDDAGQLIEKMICEYGVCGTTWNMEEGDIEVDMEKIKRLAEIKKKNVEE